MLLSGLNFFLSKSIAFLLLDELVKSKILSAYSLFSASVASLTLALKPDPNVLESVN